MHLFVLTDTWFCDEVINSAKQYLFADQKNQIGFERIYVFSMGIYLHVFDLTSETHYEIKIDNSEQTIRNIKAREMVENSFSMPLIRL